MSELRETLELLERPLTPKEESTIKWLLGWDRETVDTMDGLLMAMWKAGRFDSPSNKGEAARLHEELEDQRARANIAHRDSLEKSERMAELRAALKWYGQEENYVVPHIGCTSKVMIDRGAKARQALSTTTEQTGAQLVRMYCSDLREVNLSHVAEAIENAFNLYGITIPGINIPDKEDNHGT